MFSSEPLSSSSAFGSEWETERLWMIDVLTYLLTSRGYNESVKDFARVNLISLAGEHSVTMRRLLRQDIHDLGIDQPADFVPRALQAS